MPHVSSGGGDDLASTDEVKVYDDEGEEEQRSENLSEVKLGLVTETEEHSRNGALANNRSNSNEKAAEIVRPSPGKSSLELAHPHPYYLVPPYYQSSASLASKLPGGPSAAFPPLGLAVDALSSPPPAHMGLGRYSLPSPHSHLSEALYSSTLGPWSSAGYPPLHPGFRNPYSPSGSLMPGSPLSRFSPLPPGAALPPGVSHPALVTPAGPRHDFPLNLESHGSAFSRSRAFPGAFHDPSLLAGGPRAPQLDKQEPPERKRPHIKKPLNAFMLFMKEMRAQVVAECTLKESAAINQILGRKWHALDRAEQSKYYDMARKEKEEHMKLYPGWSARDNYAVVAKRKKRRKIEQHERVNGECTSPKKCRARFGLDQQNQWCKHCKRKKKCLRFMQGEDGSDYDVADSTQADDESLSPADAQHTSGEESADNSPHSTTPSSPTCRSPQIKLDMSDNEARPLDTQTVDSRPCRSPDQLPSTCAQPAS